MSISLGPGLEVVDQKEGAVKCVGAEEHHIFEGVEFEITAAQDVANDASYDLLFITPDTTTWARITTMQAAVEGECFLYVYETTNSAGGTALTPLNKDRNSSNTSVLTVTHTPVVTGVGTRIRIAKQGSAFFQGSVNGSMLILKQNTKYLFRITNVSGATKWVSQQIVWAEHANLV